MTAVTQAHEQPDGAFNFLRDLFKSFGEDQVTMVSAGVTYYVLLAIFPAIAAAVSLYGLFVEPKTIAADVASLSHVLPGGAITIVREEILRVAQKSAGALGLTAIVSILISLVSARGGISSLFTALDDVGHARESRGFLRFNLLALAFTLGGIVLILLAVLLVVAVPFVLEALGPLAIVVNIARWPLLLILVAVGIGVLFRYGPAPQVPRRPWLSWGSATAAILWLAVSLLFSWYAANFGAFDKTYGTLGALFGFMTWIWLSIMAVLVGAEVNEVIRRK